MAVNGDRIKKLETESTRTRADFALVKRGDSAAGLPVFELRQTQEMGLDHAGERDAGRCPPKFGDQVELNQR